MDEKPKDIRWIFFVLFLVVLVLFIGMSYPTYTQFQVLIDLVKASLDYAESWQLY